MNPTTSIRSPESRSLRAYMLAWLVMALGLALTGAVAWRMKAQARELDQDRFQRVVRQSAQAIRDRFERYELAIAGLADYLAVRRQLNQAEWRFRILLLWPEQRYPGLLEIGFAEIRDPEAGTPEHEPGSLHLLHSWVRPPSAEDGIGNRFLVEPAIRSAAQRAVQSDQLALAYGQRLSAEIGGNPALGFTVVAPVLDAASTGVQTNSGTPAPAQAAPPGKARQQGVVFGNIVPAMLLENLFGTAPREVDFELFTSRTPSADTWLNAPGERPLSLRPGFTAYLQTNVVLALPAHEWSATFYATSLFEKESARHRPRIALLVGAAVTTLVAALMFTQIRARLRQEGIAAELRAACDDLQRVQNERERLGRDLHDGAIQSLYGLQLSLGHYERQLPRDPAAARGILARCRASVDGLLAELRTYIVQHLPGEDDTRQMGNTGAALQQIVHRFQTASQVPIELVLKDSPPTPVTLGQQVHLRQVAQEAISNSLRHGRARHIKVQLRRENEHLQLRVADDGAGFDTADHHAGQGLANMQARAVQLGGQLHIRSQPGRGTEIILDIPLAPETPENHGKDA